MTEAYERIKEIIQGEVKKQDYEEIVELYFQLDADETGITEVVSNTLELKYMAGEINFDPNEIAVF